MSLTSPVPVAMHAAEPLCKGEIGEAALERGAVCGSAKAVIRLCRAATLRATDESLEAIRPRLSADEAAAAWTFLLDREVDTCVPLASTAWVVLEEPSERNHHNAEGLVGGDDNWLLEFDD